MKKITTFLGIVGVVCFFSGCTSDNLESIVAAENASADITSAASSSPSTASTSSASKDKDKNKPTSSGSASSETDTTVIHNKYEVSSKTETPNYSSGVFCWSQECAAEYADPNKVSNATNATTPGSIDINGNGGGDDPNANTSPVINGMTMTDMRDNKTYALAQVGSKLWMAQDINYELANSECYNETAANCTTYGRLYTFNAAQKACPLGWHLPSRDEASAVLADASYSWSYSGRCKDGDCNFLGDMGFHWTTGTPESSDKKFNDNGGTNGALIIVEKSPEYVKDKEGEERLFFQVDQKTKRFSVRCVQD